MCSSSVVRLRGEHVDLCTFRRDTEAILKYTEWVNNPDFNCFIGKNNAVAGYEEEEKWAKSERALYSISRIRMDCCWGTPQLSSITETLFSASSLGSQSIGTGDNQADA